MNHSPSRTRRIVLISLAVLGLACAAFLVRRPLRMSAPACVAGRWHGCFDTENGVVLMTLVGLPLAVLVAWALARRRQAGGDTSERRRRAGGDTSERRRWAGGDTSERRRRAGGDPSAWRRSLAEVGMVYGTVPFVWMTLMPGPGAGVVPGRVSLVPLRDLVTMGPIGVGGNLLVFAALGFFAPIRFAVLASVPRILALGAVCSVLVETAQYVFRLDRVSSVDDVLVNAAGAGLAALASRHWWRTTAEVPSDQSRPAPASAG